MKSGFLSAFICGFGDAAAGANEPPPVFFVDPSSKCGRLRPLLLMAMLALSILCAAMFTEPAIPQIEEMGRLVHRT
jgi:hypothetical protein